MEDAAARRAAGCCTTSTCRDGLFYASWWNDGLVILDVGNGIKGGVADESQLVSQYKYDLDALYRTSSARSGTGFIRGTHTAWRYKNYVFIADEMFRQRRRRSRCEGAVTRARTGGCR